MAKNAKMGKIQMQYFELFSNILHRTFMSFGNHFCSTFLFSIIRHGRWTFRNSGFTAVLQCCSKLQRDHFRENLKQQKMIIDPKIGIFTLCKKKLSVKIEFEKKLLLLFTSRAYFFSFFHRMLMKKMKVEKTTKISKWRRWRQQNHRENHSWLLMSRRFYNFKILTQLFDCFAGGSVDDYSNSKICINTQWRIVQII